MTEEEKESLMCALDYLSDLEEMIEDCKKLLAKALFELGGLEGGQTEDDTRTLGVCERADTDS